jgi:hypothetical protein
MLKVTGLSSFCFLMVFSTLSAIASADTVINNYGSNSQPQDQQQSQPQNSSNSNNYDSRIPPAGAYSTTNSDGSSQQLYTTGQKKPFYADNPNSQTPTPQVFVQPTIPSPTPTPPLR